MTEQELEKREKALWMAMERMLPDFVKSCRETWRPATHSSGCIRSGLQRVRTAWDGNQVRGTVRKRSPRHREKQGNAKGSGG